MRIENSFEEWGVLVPGAESVWYKGKGSWGKHHAEQEVERIQHNAKLPNVGQPTSAKVVKRQHLEIHETSKWVEDE